MNGEQIPDLPEFRSRVSGGVKKENSKLPQAVKLKMLTILCNHNETKISKDEYVNRS